MRKKSFIKLNLGWSVTPPNLQSHQITESSRSCFVFTVVVVVVVVDDVIVLTVVYISPFLQLL